MNLIVTEELLQSGDKYIGPLTEYGSTKVMQLSLKAGGTIPSHRHMLKSLNVGERDSVVEFAPGLGVTAQMTLRSNPGSEAKRLLRPGGKYAIHEMCLFPDNLVRQGETRENLDCCKDFRGFLKARD